MGSTEEQKNRIALEVVVQPKSGAKKDIKPLELVEIAISDEQFNPEGTEINIAIVGMPVEFEEESDLIVRAKKDGGRWKTIGTKSVLHRPGNATEPKLHS